MNKWYARLTNTNKFNYEQMEEKLTCSDRSDGYSNLVRMNCFTTIRE